MALMFSDKYSHLLIYPKASFIWFDLTWLFLIIWSINTEYDHYRQLIQLMMINKHIS